MALEDEFARILNSLPELDDAGLSAADAAIVASGTDVRANAERLLAGETPGRLEVELLGRLDVVAARIAVAQAIDRACAPAATRFAIRGDTTPRLEAGPQLNANVEHGLVLPMSNVDGMVDGDIDGGSGLRGFFINLLHVPAWVRATHADAEGLVVERVRLRMLRPSLADDPSFDADQPVAVGYVPLNEVEEDLGFDFRQRGTQACYSAQPGPVAGRLAAALQRLSGQGAQLIVVPETSLQHDDLPQVQAELERVADQPGCRLIAVLIGLASPPGPASRARNEVVVLGRHGNEVARQHKLTHWNLTPQQQRRYDICGHAEAGESLWEDTEPGSELVILDLPHLGRLAIHICADLQAKEPAEWVRQNLTLDWSVTPLMDSTLTYEPDKWVFRRALEAARSGRTQAVVTASMVLTQRQNRVNRAAGQEHRCTSLCGLLLLLDGRFGDEVQGLLAEELISERPTRTLANLVLHPGRRPLVRSWQMDATGQHAPRECLVVEGDNFHLVRRARLIQLQTAYSTTAPLAVNCDVEAGSTPDTLHLVFDRPPGTAIDETWDLHLIGQPTTAPDGQTITTFNAAKPLPPAAPPRSRRGPRLP